MQDLLLWRLLRQQPLAVEAVTPLLGELAQLDLKQRFPFFGYLLPLLKRPEAALRAATVRALRGACGILGYRSLIEALDDPELEVRREAVAALRESATHDCARWIHALLHSRPDVRLAAVRGDNPFAPNMRLLYVLPDPACAPFILPLLDHETPQPQHLPLILDYAEQQILPRPLARRLVVGMDWTYLLDWLNHGLHRSEEQVAEVMAAVHQDTPLELWQSLTAHDNWDAILRLFWEDPPDDPVESKTSRTFWNRVLQLEPEGPTTKVHFTRVFAALMVQVARCRQLPILSGGVCLAWNPELLAVEGLPPADLRRAARILYQQPERRYFYAPYQVERLVRANICQRPSGQLDLWLIGAVLHLLAATPYKFLVEWVGEERIIAAFHEDVEDSAALLCLRDESAQGRKYLLNAILHHLPAQRLALFARLTQAVRADDLDFLDPLDGRNAVQVLELLLRWSGLAIRSTQVRWSPNKTKRVGEILGRKIAASHAGPFLRAWLSSAAPEEIALGLRVLGVIAHAIEPKMVVSLARGLEPELLRKFLAVVTWCAGFPYAHEVELAQALATHADEGVRAWALPRLPQPATAALRARLAAKKSGHLSGEKWREIATCPDSRLAAVLTDAEPGLRVGLCPLLAVRPNPSEPSVAVCVALLATHDPPEQVAQQFQRFAGPTDEFAQRLDAEMIEHWRGEPRLPLFGHAWLYRWEEHAFALADRLTAQPNGVAGFLQAVAGWPAAMLADRVWRAVETLVNLWLWRDRQRLLTLCDETFGKTLAEAIATSQGTQSAAVLKKLRAVSELAAWLERLKPWIEARMPGSTQTERDLLWPWIDARGLQASATKPSSVKSIMPDIVQKIHRSENLEQLEMLCAEPIWEMACAAAQRLVNLGAAGRPCLNRVLTKSPPVSEIAEVARTLHECHAVPELLGAWQVLKNTSAPPAARFWLGLSLYQHHKTKVQPLLMAALLEPTEPPWFEADYWNRLLEAGLTEQLLALRLTGSAQPHLYSKAVRFLLGRKTTTSAVRQALWLFLEAGTDRTFDLRREVAKKLLEKREELLPLLLDQEGSNHATDTSLFQGLTPRTVEAAVLSVLVLGQKYFREDFLWPFVQCAGLNTEDNPEPFEHLLLKAETVWIKQEALAWLNRSRRKELTLRAVARTFSWGMQVGRQLTGKLFGVEMIVGEDLGYTRFEENKIYVNPLPLMRREMNGRDVVEGLILHELGHHVYHRGSGAQEVWKTAQDRGLHRLLNLVSDEHLERNLRARDSDFGDKLKRLGAYAFQHSRREIAVETLLNSLQSRAFAVLTNAGLGAGRLWATVSVESGEILHEMEKSGMSFARFVRALRMGLGNRHHDPQVAAGLALFRGRFRHSSMADLLTVAEKLRDIFGWQTDLLEALGQERAVEGDDGDLLTEGEGLTNQEVQKEVRRILEPPGKSKGGRGSGGSLAINVHPDEQFEVITNVVPLPFDAKQHATLAAQVARQAERMRQYFDRLGLALVPQRRRLQGRSFDRTRTQAVVLRGDPRMLISRYTEVQTDLFLGVIVDCSGSMGHDNNIGRARLFGALLAEAARQCQGIDFRLFGFTESVIYDAGNAARCAAHALVADGGNNDAAGLWHAAQVARASRRKAKLLVMISDGLPTECSVAALRGLVTKLTTRWKICCAQVAVRPLEEVCFPHYVLLEEADLSASVSRFGAVVARLVQKALRG